MHGPEPRRMLAVYLAAFLCVSNVECFNSLPPLLSSRLSSVALPSVSATPCFPREKGWPQ